MDQAFRIDFAAPRARGVPLGLRHEPRESVEFELAWGKGRADVSAQRAWGTRQNNRRPIVRRSMEGDGMAKPESGAPWDATYAAGQRARSP